MNNESKETRFSELIKDNRDKIYRLCKAYLYVKNETEDLYQEVLVNIWKSLDNFKGESKISTWIYRITINSALMYNREITKAKKVLGNQYDTTKLINVESDNDNSQREEIEVLHKSISKLKEQDRLIVSLLLEGLSYDEIADVVGIKPNYVGVKINRIKVVLANLMKEGSHE